MGLYQESLDRQRNELNGVRRNAISALIVLTIMLLACPNSLRAQNTDYKFADKTGTRVTAGNAGERSFFIDVDAGYEFMGWRPEDSPKVEYKTEGLQALRGEVGFGWNKFPLVTGSYKRSLRDTEKQKQLLETNQARESGIEQFVGGFSLLPLALSAFPDNRLLQTLLSVRYRYTQSTYFGEAIARQTIHYLPDTAVIDYVNHTVAGDQIFPAGTSLTFQSEYTEHECSIPLRGLWPVKNQDFRLGYYRARWKRIGELPVTLNGEPTFADMAFNASGFLLAWETEDRGAPGWNFDFSIRAAFPRSGSVDSVFDLSRLAGTGDFFVDGGDMRLKGWYNLYLGKTRDDGFYLTAGGAYAKMFWDASVDKTPSSSTSTISTLASIKDDLFQVFATAGYRF